MKQILVCTLIAAAVASTQQASAQTLLVDRGLPTGNLNNAAGGARSNVDWLSTTGDTLVGDTFTNSSAQVWNIDTIRLWTDGVLGTPPVALLWGGISGGSMSVLSIAGNLTPTTYVGGQGYQASGGSVYQLFQIDFAVSLSLNPGQTFSFFLDGYDPSYPGGIFAEASNKQYSLSPQDGADDTMLLAKIVNGAISSQNVTTWSSSEPGGGWDKPSDVNVQVFGSVPDASATLGLLGFALLGLCAMQRKGSV